MPASSIDTFFACSLLVILVASAMVSTAKIVQPYLNELAGLNNGDLCRGLAKYLLSNSGYPSNWGKIKDTLPTAFGLAAENQQPYRLDLDKVSRLNSKNLFSITYNEILGALGTPDISFNIKIQPLFEISISLIQIQKGAADTIYVFQVSTSRSGFPIRTWLQCYAITGSHIGSFSSSTSSDGKGIINATLPNSQNGPALLLVFAKLKESAQIMSFGCYSFGHNSESPESNGTFLQLSPLNHILNVSLRHQEVEISNAYIFTHGYSFNLSQTASGEQTLEYSIPRLLEACPMMLVLSGNNGSASFVEWVAYPQLTLEIGADFSDPTSGSKAVALTYIVSVNSVLYESIITCRSV